MATLCQCKGVGAGSRWRGWWRGLTSAASCPNPNSSTRDAVSLKQGYGVSTGVTCTLLQLLLLTCAGPLLPTPAAAGHKRLPDPQTVPCHWLPLSCCVRDERHGVCALRNGKSAERASDHGNQVLTAPPQLIAETGTASYQGHQCLPVVRCPWSVLRSSAAPVCESVL
jgi:hypothetical protein